jgi:hypothetical protein
MNKLKLLYDVTRAMRNLDKIEGVLQLKVRKDQEEVFSLRNKFEKNATGKTKTTVFTELNLDGGHVTRESVTEFDLGGHCHHGSGFLRRMFHRHHSGHGGHGEHGCCGVKGFFSKLSFAFGILSSLKVEEQENEAAVVSLNLSEIPEELKTMLQEKMQQSNCLSHHGALRECQRMESLQGVLVMTVNNDRVIETITVNLDAAALDRDSQTHALAASAEVQFA